MSKQSIERLKDLRDFMKEIQRENQEAADCALADAAQVSSVIRVLEKGDIERLETVMSSLDTAVREQVYERLSKVEQKKSRWIKNPVFKE